MADSVTDALHQLIALQSQQLNAINALVNRGGQGGSTAQNNGIYASQSPDYLSANYNPFSEGTQRMRGQLASATGRVNNGMIGSIFANQSQISAETQQLRSVEFGNRAYNSFLNGMTGFAAMGGSTLGGMLGGGLISGMIGSTVGGAVAGSLFNIGMDQAKQAQAYNKYLLQNSGRFISAGESNNERGVAGFSSADRIRASSFLRNFNTTAKISDSDTMQLLQGFTEGNLMRDASNLQSFQEKFTQLTKFVKQAALTMNTSYKETVEMMSDLQKRGINSNNFSYLASKAKITGSYTGLSATEQLATSANTAVNLTSGTGISAGQTTSNVSDISAYVSSMFDASKNDPTKTAFFNLVGNFGGVSGATSTAAGKAQSFLQDSRLSMPGILFQDYNDQTGQFEINLEKFNDVTSGRYNASELSEMAAKKLSSLAQTSPQIASQWQNFGGEYLSNMTTSQQYKYLSGMMQAYQDVIPSLAGQNLSTAQQFSVLFNDKTDAGRLLGSIIDQYSSDGGALLKNLERESSRQTMIDSINATNAGVGGNIQAWWGGIKDEVGAPFSAAGGWWNTNVAQNVSDWWSGKKYNSADFADKTVSSIDDLAESLSDLPNLLSKTSDQLNKLGSVSKETKISLETAANAAGSAAGAYYGVTTSYDTEFGRDKLSNLLSLSVADELGRYSQYGSSSRLTGKLSGNAYQVFSGLLGTNYDGSANSVLSTGSAIDAKYKELKASMTGSDWNNKSTLEKAQSYQLLASINSNFGDKFGYSADDVDPAKYFNASDAAEMAAAGIDSSSIFNKNLVDGSRIENFLSASYGTGDSNKGNWFQRTFLKSGSVDNILNKTMRALEKVNADKVSASETLVKLAGGVSNTDIKNAILNKDVAALQGFLDSGSLDSDTNAAVTSALENITIVNTDTSSMESTVAQYSKYKDSGTIYSGVFDSLASAYKTSTGKDLRLSKIDMASGTADEMISNIQANRENLTNAMLSMGQAERESYIGNLSISDAQKTTILSDLKDKNESGGYADKDELRDVVTQIIDAAAGSLGSDGSTPKQTATDSINASEMTGQMEQYHDTIMAMFREYDRQIDDVSQELTAVRQKVFSTKTS